MKRPASLLQLAIDAFGEAILFECVGKCRSFGFESMERQKDLAGARKSVAEVADDGAETYAAAVRYGVGCEREFAAALDCSHEGTFGTDAGFGLGVVDAADNLVRGAVAGTAFDGDAALSNGRQALFYREVCGSGMRYSESVESSAGEDDGVVFAGLELGEARVYVAADVAQLCVGTEAAELKYTARAAGAEDESRRHVGDAVPAARNEYVARVFSLWE